jgi:hypothetical protein
MTRLKEEKGDRHNAIEIRLIQRFWELLVNYIRKNFKQAIAAVVCS